jgi:hypothetical protein
MPSNLTTIPAPRVPLIAVDTGLISTEWYRFLFNLYTLAGSGSNTVSLDDLQLGPPPQPPSTSGGGGGSGTVTSVATGTGLTGGPITTTGTIDFAVAAVGTWAATPSSANLRAAMTDETGTGALVFANTPTLVTPILGTPTSGDFSTGTFTWPTFNQNTTGYAAGLAGGLIGSLPYQSAVNTTVFLAAGTNGQVLTLASGVPSWATPTTGTVTSVSGTGTVNGITLTGTVTSSGSLTLGGTLDLSSPPPIGNTTPSTVNATTLSGQTGVLRGTGTNLRTFSDAILTANSYNAITSTLTTVSTTTPIGSTATKFVMNSGANTGNSSDGLNWSSGTTFSTGVTITQSLFVKADAYTTLRLRSNVTGALFDIPIAGPATAPSGEITACTVTVLSNGFSRISWSFVAGTGAPANRSDYWTLKTTAANGTDGLLIVGAQLELGSVANTYIPTTTTAVYGTPTLSFSGVSTIGLQSNGALFLQPAGTGAIQAQATTSTAAGGNVRGANAVDWQTFRGSASQVASGSLSVISGGGNNTSSGAQNVIAGGANNSVTAASYGSLLGGNANIVSGTLSSVVGGGSNTSAGFYNFIGGGFTNSGTANAAVTTQSGTMNGTTAVTLSGSNANIRVGQYITGTSIAGDTYVAAISGTSLTLSKNASGSSTSTLSFFTPHGVVVGGGNNQATGSYSFIGGGGDAGTAANRNVASGDWSFVGGGIQNTASGIGSVVAGGGLNTVIGAAGNTASGLSSFVSNGIQNVASGIYSFVGGGAVNAANSIAGSTLGGYRGTTRSIAGNTVFSASVIPVAGVNGINQTALLVLARQTTDATPTALASDSSAAGTTNQVILPNNSAYYFRGSVIAGVTGAGNAKAWTFEGAIERGANAASTTIVGTVILNTIAQDAGASTWVIAITADTTNGGLRVTVTGQLATTIRWVCKIETTEMTY